MRARKRKEMSEVRFVIVVQFFTKFWSIKSFYFTKIARKLADLLSTTSISGPSSVPRPLHRLTPRPVAGARHRLPLQLLQEVHGGHQDQLPLK